MNLYIVRHGETDWNAEGRLQGQMDIKLNSNGIKQAKQIEKELKDIDFDLIISSPLKRAKRTAEIISCNKNNIIFDELISERKFGIFEGEYICNVDFKKIIFYESVESKKHLYFRVCKFMDKIKEKYNGKTILLVTHQETYSAICCYLNNEKYDSNAIKKYPINNCEIKKLNI